MNNLRFTGNDAFHSSHMEQLCFAITKRATHGEPAWEDTIGTNERVFFIVAVIFCWKYFLLNLLSLSCWHTILHNGLSLVNVSSVIHYSLELPRVRWFVVR